MSAKRRRRRAVRRERAVDSNNGLDPVMRELLDIDVAVEQGRLPGRLQEIRRVAAGEPDPIVHAVMKAELTRELKRHGIRDAADIAKAVFNHGERDRGDSAASDQRPSSTRPRLNADDLDLERITNLTWDVINRENEAKPELFAVGGVPSRIETAGGASVIRPLTIDRCRNQLGKISDWRHQDGRHALPPLHVVRNLLAHAKPPLPPLERVVGAPVFAADGSLLVDPGYHPAARVYYEPDGLVVPPVAETPTDDDVAQAVATLRIPISEFPFTSDSERAHALAFGLLPYARAMIAGPTPLCLFEKPTPRTGASLLVSALSLPVLGRPVAPMTAARDDDEWRKRITARLIGGPAIVLIDNLRDRLDSQHLSAVLTAWPSWSDRPMGLSEVREIPVRCAWAATGNNPALSNEMAGRVVRCRLDRKTDRPWEWTPRIPRLLDWETQRRAELVHAALTIIRAWIVRGRPPAAAAPTLPGFEEYCHVIGGTLSVAKIPGFLGNRDEVYALADAEGAEIRRLLRLWFERFAEAEVGVAQIFPLADEVDFPLTGKTERGLKTSLGARIGALRDRRYRLDGTVEVTVALAGELNRAARWRLIRAAGAGKGSLGSQVHSADSGEGGEQGNLTNLDEPFTDPEAAPAWVIGDDDHGDLEDETPRGVPDAEDAPWLIYCRTCGGNRYWQSTVGVVTCAGCHVPPSAEHVARWWTATATEGKGRL